MREIRFRGMYDGAWVYGSHVQTAVGLHFIIPQNLISDNIYQTLVGKNTVGQYTGLKDKNGVEIYEGDILDFDDSGYSTIRGMADFRKGRYVLGQTKGREDDLLDAVKTGYTVIGNIYENGELLNESQ